MLKRPDLAEPDSVETVGQSARRKKRSESKGPNDAPEQAPNKKTDEKPKDN
jgi:hypothetical protein